MASGPNGGGNGGGGGGGLMKNMSLLRLQYYCVLGAVAGAVLFATLRYMPAAGSGAALSTTSALATAAAPAGAVAGEHRKSKGMAKAAAKVATKPKEVVVFNFGDSNSDTGGVAAAGGIHIMPPEGRTYFRRPTGRLSDGRVIIDFICELLNHLHPSLRRSIITTSRHLSTNRVPNCEFQIPDN